MDFFLDKVLSFLRLRKIIKYIPKNSVVCDIGCGKEAYLLKKIAGFIKYGIGFDKNIKDYKNYKLEFKKLKISNRIPLEKESVDIVTMLAVLEHLENPQEILNEVFRILRNNGKLILTTPLPLAKPILEFLAAKLRVISESEIKDHKNYFWPSDIKKMLIRTGFKKENIKNYFFEFFLNNFVVTKK